MQYKRAKYSDNMTHNEQKILNTVPFFCCGLLETPEKSSLQQQQDSS